MEKTIINVPVIASDIKNPKELAELISEKVKDAITPRYEDAVSAPEPTQKETIYFNVVNGSMDDKGILPGEELKLIAQPYNKYDGEAIGVFYKGEQIGYVANSPQTCPLGCYSAGRLYDMLKPTLEGRVVIVTAKGSSHMMGGLLIGGIDIWS